MATTFAGHVMAAFTVPSDQVEFVATTNAGGPTTVTISAGTYVSVATFCTSLQSALNTQRPVTGGSWSVSVSTGAGATGKVTISVSAGTFSLELAGPVTSGVLGFSNDIVAQTSSTGDHSRGLWLPDSPIFADTRIYSGPRVTDYRQTQSPTGYVYGLIGNLFYRHRNVRWQMCPQNKVWKGDESTTYESLEQFLLDTQWNQGLAGFGTSSKCVVVAHDGTALGANNSIAGWYLKGCRSLDEIAKRSTADWDGRWAVEISELVSDS